MIQLSEMSQSILVFFVIILLGYVFGGISVKGVSLKTSAIFIVALLIGALGGEYEKSIFAIDIPVIVQNLGLVLFITSVGFIAGKNFLYNLKQYFTSYVLIGIVCVLSGSIICIVIIKILYLDSSIAVGLLSGALTSTPGYSAAQEVFWGMDEQLKNVAVGHAIAYPFGVVAVVVFVQIIPKFLSLDIKKERIQLISIQDKSKVKKDISRKLGPFGIISFSASIMMGILLGSINIYLPGGVLFSLGLTGGPLIVSLLLSGIKIRNKSVDFGCDEKFLEITREIGLMFFLVCAGYDGGSAFIEVAQNYGFILVIYGMLMTLIPMILAFIFAKNLLKMSLFNNLGAITGGMTSTPALGALVNVAKTSEVTSAYAAAYPVALVLVVLACQFIAVFF